MTRPSIGARFVWTSKTERKIATRRIVGWSEVGDQLAKGERFGMIRFGSRTEVYLPLDATVLVHVGDRVVGGSSVIARLT